MRVTLATRSLLVLVSTAAGLAVVEVTARIMVPGATAVRFSDGGVDSRELHHIYPAHAHMYMGRFDGEDVFVDTNEDGLRTSYTRPDFTTYRTRIVALGDSFTFGMGVTSEDAFPTQLERSLRQATGDARIALLNAGIVSYSPFLERLLLERRLAAYQPTLVFLLLDATDIGDDYSYMRQSTQRRETINFLAEEKAPPRYHGATLELLRPFQRPFIWAARYPLKLARKVVGRRDSRPAGVEADYYRFAVGVDGVMETNRFFIYRHPLDSTRPFFDATMRNIDDIARLSAAMGARFVLAIAPRFHHWSAKECPENWETKYYRLDEPYQYEYFRYFDEAERTYPIINLLADFQATAKYPLVFRQDPHWNAAGHAFVADTLARHLLQRHVIDSAGAKLTR